MEPKRIGNQIRSWRKKRGMTQKDLAEAMGLDREKGQVHVTMLESGKHLPTLSSTLPKLCDALGVDFDVVLFDPVSGERLD